MAETPFDCLSFLAVSAVPISILYFLEKRQNELVYNQLLGYQLAQALTNVIQQVGEHRRYSLDNRLLGSKVDLVKEATDVDGALAQLVQLNEGTQDRFGIAESISSFSQSWARIKNQNLAAGNNALFEMHHQAIGQLQQTLDKLSLSSGMLLNTSKETFLLTEITLRHLPELHENLAELRFLGMEVLARGSALIYEREQIINLLERVSKQTEDTLLALTQSNLGQVRGLEAITQQIEQAITEIDFISSFVTNSILATARPTLRPREYGSTFNQIDSSLTAHEQNALQVLRNNALREWQQVQRGQAVLFVMIALALTLTMGIVGAVVRSITGPVGQLFNASLRLRKGDLGVQVPIQSSDELGSLARTFNDTVVQLKAKAEADAEQLRQSQLLQENIGLS